MQYEICNNAHKIMVVCTCETFNVIYLLFIYLFSGPASTEAGRTLPTNSLPLSMAANDLRCSEMPHYCCVVIRV